jgi:predicted alpha/beta superfamily hydrolase
MQTAEHPLSALLPNTDYYEIDSPVANARYAIWVNYPEGTKRGSQAYPVIIVTDGNLTAPMLIPMNALVHVDPINPVQPVIQVAVGYAGADADDALRIRNRDLLPPGEPSHPSHLAAFDHAVEAGIYDKEWIAGYKVLMHSGRADAFLAFITDELFPAIAERYKVDASNCGLFGYSYGGLFAAYVALQRTALIKRIGAGSPGMMTSQSIVLRMLAEQIEQGTDHSGRHLHMTVCEREFTVPSAYQLLADNYSRFVTELGLRPLPGLTFSSRIIPEESHATGICPSWYSFLRTCYGASSSAWKK